MFRSLASSVSDPTSRNLATLEEPARSAAYWLVWAARTAGYPVIITSSRRTKREQDALIAGGLSRARHSKHLDGQAFDIDWYGWNRDDIPGWFWDQIGPWAEQQLALKWGGRWSSPYDPGHFET